jgi:hypothetical protein
MNGVACEPPFSATMGSALPFHLPDRRRKKRRIELFEIDAYCTLKLQIFAFVN